MARKYIAIGYATYPSVKLQKLTTDPETGKKTLSFVKELIFGDYMSAYEKDGGYQSEWIGEGKKREEYIYVHCRNADGYIKKSEMQSERPLEVNFIDVGQGDGCHIVTPDDEHFLVDAGQGDNMFRFLKWRFNLKKSSTPPPPFTVVISHPDADHYKGFGDIFRTPSNLAQQFKIAKVYHNGLVESKTLAKTKGKPTVKEKLQSLGTLIEPSGHPYKKYITDLCDTPDDYRKRAETVESGDFMDLLAKTDADKESLRIGSVLYEKGDLKMEVLAPIPEIIDGKPALPAFAGDKGKTKNGHSVVILLTIGHLRLLLGGDLNTESEYHLIQHYSEGIDIGMLRSELKKGKLKPDVREEYEAEAEKAVLTANKALQVDIAKSCHHGSADFTSDFLRVLNPIATIISSGDEESFVHPRPDTLGTIGKHSRGERPLIFSTELARSGKEFVKLDEIKDQDKKKERVVTVYGMINIRTDGQKAIIAQKREKAAATSNWDIHRLVWKEDKGEFVYEMDAKDA